MCSNWVFLKNCFWRLFSIKPAISTVEAFSKDIMFSFFKLNSIIWQTNFCLNIILLDNACNCLFTNMLIFKNSINFIESIWNDWTELLSSWHFKWVFYCFVFWKFYEILFLIFALNEDSDKNFNFVYYFFLYNKGLY